MTHPHQEALEKAIELHKQANEYSKEILAHKDLATIRMFTETNTLKNINYLNTLLGNAPEIADMHKIQEYGPVKNFFGKAVENKNVVTKKDLTPQQQEKDRFFAERDQMYAQFPQLTDEDILSKCEQPGGESIVRAVAKKIGIEGYKTRALDVSFIDEIRQWIILEHEQETALRDAENGIKGGTSFEPGEDDTEEEPEEM